MSRYIDAEVLKTTKSIQSADFNSIESIRKWIDNQPTADVKEVVLGEWVKPTGMMPPEHFGRHRCSKCDGFALHDWKHHKEQLTDFCPNCGAKMDERENDNEQIH